MELLLIAAGHETRRQPYHQEDAAALARALRRELPVAGRHSGRAGAVIICADGVAWIVARADASGRLLHCQPAQGA